MVSKDTEQLEKINNRLNSAKENHMRGIAVHDQLIKRNKEVIDKAKKMFDLSDVPDDQILDRLRSILQQKKSEKQNLIENHEKQVSRYEKEVNEIMSNAKLK